MNRQCGTAAMSASRPSKRELKRLNADLRALVGDLSSSSVDRMADLQDRISVLEWDLWPVAAVAYWNRQRKMWAKLTVERMKG